MPWNWQQPDWPRFRWDAAGLPKFEEQFLLGAGELAGTLRHLDDPERQRFAIDQMSSEAVTTSAIEGEILDRASVQSSLRKQFGLREARAAAPAERGIAEMTADLYRTYAEPLSRAMLFRWHRLLFEPRGGLPDTGRYRTSPQPMEIVTGALHKRRVHFEAPPSRRLRREMARFIEWFNHAPPQGKRPLAALTRAGIAHLYFESIHPFEDGNGRIGRAISEKALAQAGGQPALTGLSPVILIRRKAYYAALAAASRGNEITPWLLWFAQIALEAQKRSLAQVEFVLQKTRLLDRLRGHLNARQEKALLRMLREGPDGFKGGLSAGNYATITGASPATTTRDLAGLVETGALEREGERRYARYRLQLSA